MGKGHPDDGGDADQVRPAPLLRYFYQAPEALRHRGGHDVCQRRQRLQHPPCAKPLCHDDLQHRAPGFRPALRAGILHRGGNRPGGGPDSSEYAEPDVHLRQLHHRRFKQLCLRGVAGRSPDPRRGLQSPVHLRRSRPGQDPPDERHRQLHFHPGQSP